VRATAGVLATTAATSSPRLSVVPRRRRAARVITVAVAVIASLMIGSAAFQTQLARRQVDLDRIDRDLRVASEQYRVLRGQRAELRAPARLAASAEALGMGPATSTQFMAIPADVVAAVQESMGVVDPRDAAGANGVLDRFTEVKAVAGGAP